MIGAAKTLLSEIKETMRWNVDWSPTSGMNCLGNVSRDSGQTRVPAPPHMITGMQSGAINLVLASQSWPVERITSGLTRCRIEALAAKPHHRKRESSPGGAAMSITLLQWARRG